MSKKRPTESSWDSDEELLSDTSGITAFPKASELDLLGDDGELDEDALLGMDEMGAKTVSISFANDSVRPLPSRQLSSYSRVKVSAPKENSLAEQELAADEQAFVFEETDTADLEVELNAGREEEVEYHVGGDASAYNPSGEGLYNEASQYDTAYSGHGNIDANDVSATETDVQYPLKGISVSDGGDAVYTDHQALDSRFQGMQEVQYGGEQSFNDEGVTGVQQDGDVGEGTGGIELGYDQPTELESSVHLEYENPAMIEEMDPHSDQTAAGVHYESESDSDNEDSRQRRGKFTTERTGMISLTTGTTTKASIPDTLEIDEEQAAKIDKFMSDKPQRGKHARGRGRPSAHSRLGGKGGNNPPQALHFNQRPRGGMGPGILPNQGPQRHEMRPSFPQGPQNRGPFPGGMFNPRIPLPLGLLQQTLFSVRPSGPRGPYGSDPGKTQQERFPGPNVRSMGPSFPLGSFPGGPAQQFPRLGSQRLPFPRGVSPNGPQRPPAAFQGPRGVFSNANQMRPNQLQDPRDQIFQQRGPPGNPFMRGPHPNQQNIRQSGPRPFMGPPRSTGPSVEQGQPIPCLVKPVSTPPHTLKQQRSPQPRKFEGPPRPLMQVVSQQPRPVLHGVRPRGPSGLQSIASRLGQSRPKSEMHFGPKGDAAMKKHKIYINPRFQGNQGTTQGITRTVRWGMPAQQKRAKMLLDKAIHGKNKPDEPQQTVGAGLKRRSTGADEVPIKTMKTDEKTQAQNEPMDEDSNRIKALLEEQKRQREMIKKKKEMARQKQALETRKVLEKKLKEEGKTIQDVVGGSQAAASAKPSQPPRDTAAKHGGSMESRLGPAPKQSRPMPGPQARPMPGQQSQPMSGPQPHAMPGQQPRPLSGPQPHTMPGQQMRSMSGPQPHSIPGQQPQPHSMPGQQPRPMSRPQPHAMPGQQPQSISGPQPRAMPGQQLRPVLGPQPHPMPGQQQPHRMTGPLQSHPMPPALRQQPVQQTQPNLQRPPVFQSGQEVHYNQPPTLMSQGPPQGQPRHPSDPRFRVPPPSQGQPTHSTNSQFGGPPQNQSLTHAGQSYGSSAASPSLNVRAPPPITNPRFSGPPPNSNSVFRGPSPAADPNLRGPPLQVSENQFNPTAPASSSSLQFQGPPPNMKPAYNTPQEMSYPDPTYPLPQTAFQQPQAPAQEQRYAAPPPVQQPPPTSFQPVALVPVQTPQQQQYEQHYPPQVSPQVPNYPPPSSQTPHQATHYTQPNPQYATPPSNYPTHSYDPSVQHQEPVAHVPTPAAQSQHYQSHPTSQYQENQYDAQYSHSHYDYYADQQPIQRISTVSSAPSAPDQRTVQHHSPVGQRIQTIAQRVQPASGTEMRSIIHNVTSPRPAPIPASPSSRVVQARTQQSPAAGSGSRVVADGQVPVLEGPQKIVILNVPQMATRETLIKICKHFGRVLGFNLIREQDKAVVQFETGAQAAKCVSKCNQKCLHKMRITVKLLPH